MKRTELTADQQKYMDEGAEKLKVRPVDVKKLAEEVTIQLVEQLPHLKGKSFYIQEHAFITPNILLDKECCSVTDDKKVPFLIRRESEKTKDEDGKETTQMYPFACWDFDVPLSKLKPYLLPEISLKEFMGERYDYNKRIRENTIDFLDYVVKPEKVEI